MPPFIPMMMDFFPPHHHQTKVITALLCYLVTPSVCLLQTCLGPVFRCDRSVGFQAQIKTLGLFIKVATSHLRLQLNMNEEPSGELGDRETWWIQGKWKKPRLTSPCSSPLVYQPGNLMSVCVCVDMCVCVCLWLCCWGINPKIYNSFWFPWINGHFFKKFYSSRPMGCKGVVMAIWAVKDIQWHQIKCSLSLFLCP